MSETDPLRDVLDRVLSRMHHSMKRLSYRLRSEVDSPEVQKVLGDHWNEIAHESEIIAFYMAEHPPLVTHTEWGVRCSDEDGDFYCWSEDKGTAIEMKREYDGKELVTRQVTAWEPAKEEA